MKSWRTTTLGILGIVGLVVAAAKALIDGDPNTNPDWGIIATQIPLCWAAIVARDNKVTSEAAGAK